MEPTANAFPGAACYSLSVRAARRKRNRTRKTRRRQEEEERKKRMTEKKDQKEEEEEEKRKERLGCQALHSRRVYTPWAPLPAMEHTAKATPTQRMNGRQTSLHVLTYPRTYASNIANVGTYVRAVRALGVGGGSLTAV